VCLLCCVNLPTCFATPVAMSMSTILLENNAACQPMFSTMNYFPSIAGELPDDSKVVVDAPGGAGLTFTVQPDEAAAAARAAEKQVGVCKHSVVRFEDAGRLDASLAGGLFGAGLLPMGGYKELAGHSLDRSAHRMCRPALSLQRHASFKKIRIQEPGDEEEEWSDMED